MVGSYWKQVMDSGLGVPTDRPLDDLTAELTRMLGSADPLERDHTAYPTLATWIDRGVYDRLLGGLGDGLAAGLRTGIGETGTDTVFRRSFSALLLSECVARDTRRGALVPSAKILDWGDRIVSWYLRERDDRGFVDGKGWAHSVAHGADAIGVLAGSPYLAAPELTVLLDVLADRMLAPGRILVSGEPDRVAEATLRVLRRNVLPVDIIEPWVRRIAARATAYPSESQDPYLVTGNPEAFLRSLHLQLQLAPDPPQMRPDLLLVLVDALRQSNPGLRVR